MKLFLSLLFVVCFTNAKSQLITDSILIENNYRTFAYNLPKTKIKNGSLLFVLHGSGGSGKGIISQTKNVEAIADKEKLLIIYPDGYKNYWNECRRFATSAANKENINENAFFAEMIKYFEVKFNIDTIKVYVVGFSGGGHMAYKLAMTMPNKIHGIAAIVANMPDSASCDCNYANKPLPVLIVNSTADNVNPYNGGEMFVNNTSYGVVKSTVKTFEYWASLAGYFGFPPKRNLPNKDTTDNCYIESHTCSAKNKPTIRLLKVVGGKHEFPKDIDVFLYAWEFFKKSRKRK
jgi:polyhydroxybutyrate depolymerase